MIEEAGKTSGIEKFDGTNFAYWRMQIEDYFYGRKLHLPLLGTKPESMKVEEWTFLDRQVLGVIRLTLSRSVAHNVVKEKTTTDLMKALSDMYKKSSANNKYVEIDFDDEIRALIILASLPNSWEAMRMAKKNEDDSANAVTEEVHDALLLAIDSPLDDWVLDSGASFRTTPHREIIQNYAVGDFGKVYLADGLALDVVGLGDVLISLPNGSVWLLENVRHIPDLRRNLISIGQLDDERHAILFVGGTWKVTKGARVLARRKKTGTLYMTLCPRDIIAVADASTDTSLWHHRLGHMSEKWMKVLLSKGKLLELKSIDFDMCESCILGKQKNVSFLKTGKTLKAEKLELVHTDLWRPSSVASLGGSRKWKAMVETETCLKVKCLRSDNGREYIDGGFSEYCVAQGIRMEKTIPGTLQQNGVAECMNRTLNERARIPMEFRLPEEVWSDKEVMYKDKSTIVSDVTKIDQKKSEFVNLDELTEKCYDEALQDENSSKWELTIKDEMDSLLGKKALHNKWVYRIKNEHDGSKHYKARLVVKGFQQKKGIDYTEIFSLVVKMSTIKLVLGMVVAENLHLEQLDVKTTFLHGDLEEDLYMIQLEEFIVQGQENLVCKLRNSLYGLKQAPKQWYKKFDNFMHRIKFKRCEPDHCYYVKSFDNSYIILLLYVDDMLIVGSDIEKINNVKKQLSKQFAMKDLGAVKQILAKPMSTPLGSHFKLSKEQSPKTEKERYHMSKVPYASAIGSLMYVMVCTRPDIAHAVRVVSRFMSASLKLQGYVDVDFVGDIDSRKSTTGFVFTLGGTSISWASNLQKIVTLSTTEAEYVATTEAEKEMIWLYGFLDELGKKQEMGILQSDSQSAIFLAKNSAFHSKSKHIQTKYHFIRYLVEDKLVILEKICGSKNPANMLTKGVTIEKLKLCAASIGLLA
ncbi:Retrovirus-related Pol polyprotein from transposon TNT 1-94 [Vitis vinifera]|uniref:Retrovirus-related Pol polyprotein from transposon TNT 1-94 n=1 Tax=Vitis vinifera TaxID=29760 RepID=A0A438IRM6_VITVI|nr:Retrovirus-related Pol polyprotein from transposon TNT 1-94 [Vitis vinifera]